MKGHQMTEAERLAFCNTLAFGVIKEFKLVRESMPFVLDAFMESQARIDHGHLCQLCLTYLYLYERAVKAGIVEQSAVEAEFLVQLRETVKEAKAAGLEVVGKIQTEYDALKEFYSLLAQISRDMALPGMPSSESVIEKARKP
jgi:hypothetical protein